MAILSIQSHVAYGYAGNTSAVFPLQRLGYEVWAVNTVEFSNHTGYGSWRGRALGGELVTELVDGIAGRGVLSQCEAVLSGYLGEAGIALAVKQAVENVKKEAPDAVYCCDPVIGDYDRGVYVQDGILEMFREKLLPLAAIVTPNQFELGLLTGVDLSRPAGSKGALNAALDAVHKSGPKTVLVTSLRRPRGGEIGMLVSESGGIWEVSTPEFAFTQSIAGGGDLTAAVFLARFLETKNARLALEQTASSVFGIMEATYKSGQRELRTIAAQEELAAPSRHFTSKRFVAG